MNYTTNLNYENYLNNNLRLFNNIYLRKTKAEYDNSNSNQTGYEGDNRMGTFQFGLENLKKLSNKKYIFYYNLYDRNYEERGTIDSYRESEVIGLKYDISKIINKNISIGGGSEYKYDWGYFDNNGSYQASTKGHSDIMAIYGNIGYKLPNDLKISLFARNDDHKHTKRNNSYKLNLGKELFNSNFGISYMKGLRNPILYELFGTDNYGATGNINLSPEKSNTYEIYTDLELNKNLDVSLRGFRSNIKNNIEYINNKYRNDDDNIDLNQSGIDASLNLNFFKNQIGSHFSSFLSSKKENGSAQLRRPGKKIWI